MKLIDAEAAGGVEAGGHAVTVVAIVDPDETTRRRLVRTLEGGELITIEASDGLEALRTTFASRPNAAVIDLQTTGIDGLELVRVMRAACDMPIIAVAPAGMAQLTVRALDAGADDVIERTCSPECAPPSGDTSVGPCRTTSRGMSPPAQS